MAAKAKKSATKAKSKKVAPKKSAPKKVAAKKVATKKAVKNATAKAPVKKLTKATKAKTPTLAPSKKAPITSTGWDKLITPLDDRLVVAPQPQAETTAGGIIIPGVVNNRPSRGQVLAAGRGRRNKKGQVRPLDVRVGDHVMFAEWSGTKIQVDGREVLILREEDILGVVS